MSTAASARNKIMSQHANHGSQLQSSGTESSQTQESQASQQRRPRIYVTSNIDVIQNKQWRVGLYVVIYPNNKREIGKVLEMKMVGKPIEKDGKIIIGNMVVEYRVPESNYTSKKTAVFLICQRKDKSHYLEGIYSISAVPNTEAFTGDIQAIRGSSAAGITQFDPMTVCDYMHYS